MASESVSFSVEGMSCQHCVNSIKKSVGAIDGIMNIGVDLKSKKVNVTYNPEKVDVDTIKETIEEQGYDVQ